MTNVWQEILAKKREVSGRWLFFRRALAHPLQLATPLPSSAALGRLVVRHIANFPGSPGPVIEVGGGTGVITRELLGAGLPADRLIVVELDPELAAYLRHRFPGVRVLAADAGRLPELMPSSWLGNVGTVINGVPMTVLSLAAQRRLLEAMFGVLGPKGRYLQYTYSLFSPLPAKRLGVAGRRLGMTFGNFPPASLWNFERQAA
jgi:phosphatidylethanolamine/phosphatidyl-N-methylethanolamine N-methyltransferase